MKECFILSLLLSLSLTALPSPVSLALHTTKYPQESSPTLPATGMTFIVSNANDTGMGSLRQAILEANASPGTDVISFSIGSGVQTVSPLSALPTITDPVIIDGTSQPGFSGSPIIELDGSKEGAGANGLDITAGSSTVKGLVLNNFSGVCIQLAARGNNTITGNYIGTDLTGTLALGRFGTGVLVFNTPDNMIGGDMPGAGNLISGNKDGVDIFGSAATGNWVQGNYIGTDVSGTAALGNSSAGVVVLLGSYNTIGGTMAGAANVISSNGVGVFLFVGATGNQIAGNLIGTSANGVGALGNVIGVRMVSADNNSIGGTSSGAGNRIAYNRFAGVSVKCGASCSVNNSILSNSIVSNIGLGIDLDENGVTLNNSCGVNRGPNMLQSFPALTSVISNGFAVTIQGTLNSTPNKTFLIQFFANSHCHPSGFGEGETFVGSTSIETNNCDATFNVTLPAAIRPGQVITATATDESGNTSEFSQCIPVIEVAQFDVCIQDNGNGNVLRINSSTGDYQFTNCSGFTLSGTGGLIKRGAIITMQHYAGDRRVLARIDGGVNKATAYIQAQGLTLTITDRNTADDTCVCTDVKQ